MDTASTERRRARVDRREAARILNCSRDNVRRLDKVGQLRSGKRDHNGTFTYDRREIEKLAGERGLKMKPNGELAARVFAMFKARKRFEDIVIDTEQDPDTILSLWHRFRAGFSFHAGSEPSSNEDRADHEHESAMRAMDAELARRRRGLRDHDQ